MSIRCSLLFALALSLCAPVRAQQAIVPVFTPNPAPQGVNVRMTYGIPRPGCGEVISTNVARTGTSIRVDYVLGLPVGTVCIGVPPPGTLIALDLGGLPPGNYNVTAFGTDPVFQFVVPVVSGTFGVVATSSVPAVSPWLIALLGTLAALVGAFALRRRTLRA